MKKLKVLSAALLLFSLGLSSCNQGSSNKQDNTTTSISDLEYAIQQVYLKYQASGGSLTYEEWLESIKGEPGQNGKDGTSIKTGQGVPSTSIGNNGDSYIDIENWNYYLKSNDSWILLGSIRGVDGVAGPKGDKGDTGPVGPQGPKGNDGHSPVITISNDGYWEIDGVKTNVIAQGSNGQNGSDGTSLRTGNTDPESSLGVNGDSYVNLVSWDYFVKANGEWVLQGNIKGKDAEVDMQGLEFFLLDDGTYAVGIGSAGYLSNIVIPEMYRGREVTEILEYFLYFNFNGSYDIERTIHCPSTIRKIGSNAFRFQTQQTTIEFDLTEEQFNEIEFGDECFDEKCLVVLTDTTIDFLPEPVTSVDLDFWTGFGSDYTAAIEGVIDHYNNLNSGKIHLTHTRKKDYNSLRTEILNSRASNAYPNVCTGYPDHFADYADTGILVPLDRYIERYDEEHGLTAQGKSIIDDYYPDYMVENQGILHDDDGNPLTSALPFSKTTEVMVVNGYYLDYFQSIDPEIVVPTTWEELATVSAKINAVIDAQGLNQLNNQYIIANYDSINNKAVSPFTFSDEDTHSNDQVVIDISELTAEKPFYTLGYDSGENAFITLLKQWGVPYTTADDGGRALFWQSANKAATTEVLQYFQDLSQNHAFAVPETFVGGQLFCSKFLEKGRCLFNIQSSGALSRARFSNRSLRVAPIPYHSVDKKFVIAQGTSLGLLNKYNSVDTYDDEMYNAFSAMVDLTTSCLQAEWATTTGYFPTSYSANNDERYQQFLHNVNPTRLEALYRDAGSVNHNCYIAANGWTKFVDPGFVGSNSIRVSVGNVLRNIFAERSVEDAMDDAWAQIDERFK